jgi:hypothetical protein
MIILDKIKWKKNYEAQLSNNLILNDEIKNKRLKKEDEEDWVVGWWS